MLGGMKNCCVSLPGWMNGAPNTSSVREHPQSHSDSWHSNATSQLSPRPAAVSRVEQQEQPDIPADWHPFEYILHLNFKILITRVGIVCVLFALFTPWNPNPFHFWSFPIWRLACETERNGEAAIVDIRCSFWMEKGLLLFPLFLLLSRRFQISWNVYIIIVSYYIR